MNLDQVARHQERALHHYRSVYRSYLRWRRVNLLPHGQSLAAASESIVLAEDRVRCKALGIVTPPNWCWHARAARWTQRELAETKAALERREWVRRDADWLTAVAFADRIFPGTAGWLRACSDSEGGWGRWGWNAGGHIEEGRRLWLLAHPGTYDSKPGGSSGAGGPMQFLRGTFYGNTVHAFAAAKQRGVVVPTRYMNWYSKVGQAVTAAWMLGQGQSRQWMGVGC